MKEDDMDELMRKAAENYEVDADKAADWNFVYKAVHETEAPPPAKEKRKRRLGFWWLLFIPLGWIANTEYNRYYTSEPNKVIKVAVSPVQPKAEENIKNKQPAAGQALMPEEASTVRRSVALNKIFSLKNFKTQADNTLQPEIFSLAETTEKEQQTSLPLLQNANNNEAGRSNNLIPDNKDVIENASPPINSKNDSSTVKANEKPAENNTSKEKKSIPLHLKKSDHYFYAGLMAGGDLSFIKNQKTQSLGYNLGLLVGYKFKKFSLESGFFYNKKNYYTKGRYFDKSNIPYFQDYQILTVDGYCRMFEIPLNARYNFIEKNRHTFFATAGLSSYLMNKEFYNYDYIRNGEQHYASRAYLRTTKNWFSILNLSAGYELQTGTKTSLRIEPYFKTPLSGVGTGKLSVSSIGINAGIVRRMP